MHRAWRLIKLIAWKFNYGMAPLVYLTCCFVLHQLLDDKLPRYTLQRHCRKSFLLCIEHMSTTMYLYHWIYIPVPWPLSWAIYLHISINGDLLEPSVIFDTTWSIGTLRASLCYHMQKDNSCNGFQINVVIVDQLQAKKIVWRICNKYK